MAKHTPGPSWTDIVFDGPPDHVSPHFIEVEDERGQSIRFGDWLQREDGYWVLRIPANARLIAEAPEMRNELFGARLAITEAVALLDHLEDYSETVAALTERLDSIAALLARIDGGNNE